MGAPGVPGAGAAGLAGAAPDFDVCSSSEPVPTSVGVRFTDSVSEVSMKTMAHQVVARERKVAAPRGPKAVWLPAPPNAPARSAALPLCSMITMISTRTMITDKHADPFELHVRDSRPNIPSFARGEEGGDDS